MLHTEEDVSIYTRVRKKTNGLREKTTLKALLGNTRKTGCSSLAEGKKSHRHKDSENLHRFLQPSMHGGEYKRNGSYLLIVYKRKGNILDADARNVRNQMANISVELFHPEASSGVLLEYIRCHGFWLRKTRQITVRQESLRPRV